ncbi:hypothetical protein [Hyphomicrobium sp. CS1GBMeth3]|uniref:hypothetical protein n=1 Tax=Hyphomicrobium sp. CS1GBMeth3 TaxID=1892845 RepID=UPI0015C551C5|nr:hypothetical protein [Hyphomicrobium sp. CS1GBMeth3]
MRRAPTLSMALILLLLRATLSQADASIRSAYLTAIVAEYERPTAAAITSVSSRFAASAGPAVGGALLATSFRGWQLVICGALKIVYDLLLLLEFRHVKPPKDAKDMRGSTVPQGSSRPWPPDSNSLPRSAGNN